MTLAKPSSTVQELICQTTSWVSVADDLITSRMWYLENDADRSFLNENRLIPALGIISLALEYSNNSGIPPVFALQELKMEGAFDSPDLLKTRVFLKRGLEETRKVRPHFKLLGDGSFLKLDSESSFDDLAKSMDSARCFGRLEIILSDEDDIFESPQS